MTKLVSDSGGMNVLGETVNNLFVKVTFPAVFELLVANSQFLPSV